MMSDVLTTILYFQRSVGVSMAYACVSRALRGLTALAAAIAGLACRVEADPRAAPPKPHLEVWSGGEAFTAVWSAYSGAGWAPFGSVHEDGLRLRAVLGTGAYDGGRVAFADVL